MNQRMAIAINYSGRVELDGINPFVWIAATDMERFAPGRRRPVSVCVRLGDVCWRTHLISAGDGRFRLYLPNATRKPLKVEVGRTVHGLIEHSPPNLVESFAPLDEELAGAPMASASWRSLRPSLRREITRYLASLKSIDAKTRNVQRAIAVLGGEPGRFLARSWRDGRPTSDEQRGRE